MRIKYIFTILAGILALLAVPAVPADASGTGSDWKLYSAFHNNPHRIMDGERYTYFFVYQQTYNANNAVTTFGIPCGTIFFYDKQNPDGGIRSIHDKLNLNDSQMGIADYNPRQGYMVICYVDGGIDVVDDNGAITYITELKDRPNQQQCKVVSISYDLSGDIWIGLRNGFMHIDGSSKKVLEAPRFGVAVNCITRVGDRVVAWMGNQIYDAPASADLNNVYSFSQTGEAVNSAPRSFMPLNDNSFAFVGNISSIGGGSIRLAKYHNGKWSSSPVVNDNLPFTGLASNPVAYFGNSLENNVIVNRDGYLLFNKDYIYQVNLGLTEAGSLDCKKRSLLWKNQKVYGSWDFETFWYFTDPGKFCMKKADGFGADTKWTNMGGDIPTSGPRAFRRVSMAYSPEYGMLSVNKGKDQHATFNSKVNPALLSGLKDGKWNDYGPAYHRPSFVSDGTEYTGKYNKNYYPVCDPYTLTVDPVFPDYAFMGSFLDGLVAVNMADPTLPALHWATPDNHSANLPGFAPLFPNSTWRMDGNSTCPVKVIGFDNEDNLWVLFNSDWIAGYSQSYVKLFCLPLEARRAMLETHDVTKCGEWVSMFLPTRSTGMDVAAVLKHPKNQNKIIVFTTYYDRSLIIYDHNGTIADTSDDKEVIFDSVLNPFGGVSFLSTVLKIVEDPVSGDVYLVYDGGVAVIDVNASLINGKMPSRALSVLAPGGNTQYVGMSSVINDLSIDEYNRMWISTCTDGIIGVNPERTEIIAHFRSDNSPLPDNHVYASCWDPSLQRLFISTEKGLASVKPDAPVGTVSPTALKAFPTMIDEEYGGTVTVYNVSGISAVKVRNSHDEIVATLPAPKDNVTYWNLLDDSGKSVPSGRYTIYDANGFIESTEIVLVR